ncbi:hypothetical protein SS50377_26146 [Spironucleus salmonicida]|uniref:Uncharacterized protein n=1 Tax=Spironucleus salmonicida TaxID=348837 RepID=V6LTM9_9EUKA|nr:hypothetical protein SS50377_26146 [Spironucleus salmonicida]|eukprot:EST47051.1 Hypothetical protein SS50377_12898 [Spironucleus salmonicida]
MNLQTYPTFALLKACNSSEEVIKLARMLAVHNLYIQSTIPGKLPIITHTMPSNCQFLQFFQDQQPNIQMNYRQFVLQTTQTQMHQQIIIEVKSFGQFFDSVEQADFILFNGKVSHCFDYFNLLTKYVKDPKKRNHIGQYLIAKAIQYRKSLPVYNFDMQVNIHQIKEYCEKDINIEHWIEAVTNNQFKLLQGRLDASKQFAILQSTFHCETTAQQLYNFMDNVK